MSPTARDAPSAVGERIRAHRLRRKLTQTELARQIGIQQSDLSRIEQGRYRVSLDVLFRLLGALHLSLTDFFGERAGGGGVHERETRLLHLFRFLSPEDQDEVLEFVRFKRSRNLHEGG